MNDTEQIQNDVPIFACPSWCETDHAQELVEQEASDATIHAANGTTFHQAWRLHRHYLDAVDMVGGDALVHVERLDRAEPGDPYVDCYMPPEGTGAMSPSQAVALGTLLLRAYALAQRS